MVAESKNEFILHKAIPVDFLWIPKSVRWLLGWITLTLFALSFLSPFFIMILFIPTVWNVAPIFATSFLLSVCVSYVFPLKEWPAFRKIGQLWYEILDFSCNLSPKEALELLDYCDHHQLILAMHPHGIIPYQGVLWSAYCDQYISDGKREMYGFGAAADAVAYIPFLRNVIAWLAGGSASYKSLRQGLVEGKVKVVNRAGRIPKHLMILPGGVAEIFCSKPKYNAMVFKSRKGLIKLSLETKAELVPSYMFGGTDFFYSLATSNSLFSKLSRKFQLGMTIFWGQFGLPIPFAPKVTLIIGKPIVPSQVPWTELTQNPEELSQAMKRLHSQFMHDITTLFNRYKELAGYPDSTLDIL